MFFYYEAGRNTWAVRNDANELVGRFALKDDAVRMVQDAEKSGAH